MQVSRVITSEQDMKRHQLIQPNYQHPIVPTIPDISKYGLSAGYWINNTPNNIDVGVKIHVTAPNGTVANMIASTVLPILCNCPIKHKVLADLTNLGADDQNKKFITVYPENSVQLIDIGKQLDEKLMHLSAKNKIKIIGDAEYGSSGFIFFRHGGFIDDKGDRSTVAPILTEFLNSGKDDNLFREKHKQYGDQHKRRAALLLQQQEWQ